MIGTCIVYQCKNRTTEMLNRFPRNKSRSLPGSFLALARRCLAKGRIDFTPVVSLDIRDKRRENTLSNEHCDPSRSKEKEKSKRKTLYVVGV